MAAELRVLSLKGAASASSRFAVGEGGGQTFYLTGSVMVGHKKGEWIHSKCEEKLFYYDSGETQ